MLNVIRQCKFGAHRTNGDRLDLDTFFEMGIVRIIGVLVLENVLAT